MKTENTLPLYKALNEKRTQRIWTISDGVTGVAIQDKDSQENWQIAKFIEGETLGGKKISCPRSHKTALANAQYTALAVNNISPIADALLLIKEVLESWNGDGKYTNLINHADNALSANWMKAKVKEA